MPFDIRNSILPPNFTQVTEVTEVHVPKHAKIEFKGFSLGKGYSGCVRVNLGTENIDTQLNTGEKVILVREGRFPKYQIVTGK